MKAKNIGLKVLGIFKLHVAIYKLNIDFKRYEDLLAKYIKLQKRKSTEISTPQLELDISNSNTQKI